MPKMTDRTIKPKAVRQDFSAYIERHFVRARTGGYATCYVARLLDRGGRLIALGFGVVPEGALSRLETHVTGGWTPFGAKETEPVIEVRDLPAAQLAFTNARSGLERLVHLERKAGLA